MNEIANTLHTLLAHNIVYFTFRKVNGEIRHAVGTRNLDIARNHTGEYIPNPRCEEQPNSYYDVEVMGWRSYKPENLISIDRVNDFDYATSEPIQQTKKPELPKREIPVKFHTADGTDIPIGTAKVLGSPSYGELPIGDGKSVRVKTQPVDLSGLDFKPISKEEIRKSMDDLDKDITIVNTTGKRFNDGKIHTPVGGVPVPVDDFARLVAKYVVDEFVSRIKG